MGKIKIKKGEIKHFYELLREMTERELRSRYKYTIFGFLWMVLNPLLQMIIIGFIFNFFMKQPIQNYYYFLFIGLLTWNFFTISISKTTPSIINERSLIKKSKFSHSVIPLSIVISNFAHLLIAMSLVSISVIFIGTLTISTIFYVIAAFILLIVFTTGLSLLFSALNVKFRDVNFFVQAFMMFWFYATPVIYPLSVIPYKYYWLWRLNPMTSILQLLQHGLLKMPLPGIGMITVNTTIILVSFILGIVVFNKQSKDFDDWV